MATLAIVALAAELWLRAHPPEPLRGRRKLVHVESGLHEYWCYPSNPNGELERAPELSDGPWKLLDFHLPPRELPLAELSETPFCAEARYSSQGIRDRFYAPMPAPGTLRIAGVGDSFAIGQGVPLERTLFRHMERMLGDGFEIVNAASVGLTPRDERQVLEQVTAALGATRGIVVFVPNDIPLPAPLLERQSRINDLINVRDTSLLADAAKPWYAGGPRLLDAIGSKLDTARVRRDTIRWYLDSYDPEQNPLGLASLAEDFERMAALDGVEVVVVLYPLLVGLDRDYPLAPVHERVAELAREAGLPVLDLAPAFAGRTTRELQVHRADLHPNGAAHEIAAGAIVDWLRADVPDFLARPPAPTE